MISYGIFTSSSLILLLLLTSSTISGSIMMRNDDDRNRGPRDLLVLDIGLTRTGSKLLGDYFLRHFRPPPSLNIHYQPRVCFEYAGFNGDREEEREGGTNITSSNLAYHNAIAYQIDAAAAQQRPLLSFLPECDVLLHLQHLSLSSKSRPQIESLEEIVEQYRFTRKLILILPFLRDEKRTLLREQLESVVEKLKRDEKEREERARVQIIEIGISPEKVPSMDFNVLSRLIFAFLDEGEDDDAEFNNDVIALKEFDGDQKSQRLTRGKKPRNRGKEEIVIVVGLPKSGTTSIASYFTCANRTVSHYFCRLSQRREKVLCGVAIRDNVAQGRDPFFGLEYDVFAQMDSNGAMTCYYPQVETLQEIHSYHPHATFILNERPVKNWLKSVNAYPHLHERLFRRCNISNSPWFGKSYRSHARKVEDSMLAEWFATHSKFILDFVKLHPSHRLVNINIESPVVGLLLEREFGISASLCWRKEGATMYKTSYCTVNRIGCYYMIVIIVSVTFSVVVVIHCYSPPSSSSSSSSLLILLVLLLSSIFVLLLLLLTIGGKEVVMARLLHILPL